MNGAELGRRIKEARLARKMTQSDVVGTFITRNMLSQIESGSACPSVKTLEYLAKVLEVPMNYLMPDEERIPLPELSSGDDKLIHELLMAKERLVSGSYGEAVDAAEKLAQKGAPLYDEGAAILARAYLAVAKIQDQDGLLQSAINSAERALSLAGEGVYASREVRTAALLLIDSLADKKTGTAKQTHSEE